MDSESTALPPYLRPTEDGVILCAKVQPRAPANSIEGPLGNELRIKITAPPVDSAANEALVRFLAKQLDVPRNRVELLRGHTSRHKQIQIHGLQAQAVLKKLNVE